MNKKAGPDPLATRKRRSKRALGKARTATKPEQPDKTRLVIYVTPAVARALWQARNERAPGQGRSLGAIVEDALRKHLKLA